MTSDDGAIVTAWSYPTNPTSLAQGCCKCLAQDAANALARSISRAAGVVALIGSATPIGPTSSNSDLDPYQCADKKRELKASKNGR
jgi:hypothetical protein